MALFTFLQGCKPGPTQDDTPGVPQHNNNNTHNTPGIIYCDNVNKIQTNNYRNKIYRGIILHCTYSFWPLRHQTPLDPLGDFHLQVHLPLHPCH